MDSDLKPSTAARIADISAWVAVWLFLSGGMIVRGVFFGKRTLVELNYWGLALIPLLLLITFGRRGEWRELSIVRQLHRLWPYLGKTATAVSIALTLGTLNALAMLARHDSFSSEWDLSIYANACSNGLHSSLRNHTTLMADHFEPILAALVPFCSQFNAVTVLLLAQSLAWTLGSFGVRRLALHAGWSHSLATVVMALYLLFAGNQTVAYYDFHPYALSLGTVPWLLVFAWEKRFLLLAFMTLLHLSLKENTALFIVSFGAFLFLRPRDRQEKIAGAVLTIVGTISFILIMKWVFPYFRQGADSEYFTKYYGYLGNTMQEFLSHAVTKPWVPALEMLRFEKWSYYLSVFLPFAFLPFLRPILLVPILPAIAIATLSNVPEMYSAHFHYEAEVYSWLFCASILVTQDERARAVFQKILDLRLFRRTVFRPRPLLQPVMIWMALMISLFVGMSPMGRFQSYTPSRPQLEVAAKLSQLQTKLKDCRVASVERVVPHLASVPQITMLPEHTSADAIVVAYPQGKRLWITPFETIENEYVPLWNQNYRLIRPLDYDLDFRVWVKPPCILDL